MLRTVFTSAGVCALVFASSAQAANIMPDFADVPTGWTTDRFEPNSFSNVGTFQGRDNVLGIEITDAQASANRPGGQQGTFYNTQGRKHLLSGGIGDSIGADLFIETDWRDESNGTIRSDMWGTMVDATDTITAYGIIGFTNLGDAPRFRIYDFEAGGDGWVDLATAVAFGDWVSFEMELTASSFIYSINGAVVYTDNTTGGATNFREVIMQAYNFGDPSLTGVTAVDYTAHWSNTEVPEPAALGLLGLGFAGLLAARRRKA